MMTTPVQQVTVTIRADGNVLVRVQGKKGRECVQLAAWVEQALGCVEERIFTGEYYEHPTRTESGSAASRVGRD